MTFSKFLGHLAYQGLKNALTGDQTAPGKPTKKTKALEPLHDLQLKSLEQAEAMARIAVTHGIPLQTFFLLNLRNYLCYRPLNRLGIIKVEIIGSGEIIATEISPPDYKSLLADHGRDPTHPIKSALDSTNLVESLAIQEQLRVLGIDLSHLKTKIHNLDTEIEADEKNFWLQVKDGNVPAKDRKFRKRKFRRKPAWSKPCNWKKCLQLAADLTLAIAATFEGLQFMPAYLMVNGLDPTNPWVLEQNLPLVVSGIAFSLIAASGLFILAHEIVRQTMSFVGAFGTAPRKTQFFKAVGLTLGSTAFYLLTRGLAGMRHGLSQEAQALNTPEGIPSHDYSFTFLIFVGLIPLILAMFQHRIASKDNSKFEAKNQQWHEEDRRLASEALRKQQHHREKEDKSDRLLAIIDLKKQKKTDMERQHQDLQHRKDNLVNTAKAREQKLRMELERQWKANQDFSAVMLRNLEMDRYAFLKAEGHQRTSAQTASRSSPSIQKIIELANRDIHNQSHSA